MARLRKKGNAGEANRFISRNKAIRKLQLDIHSFNRLCIIKGLFPIEPKNRIRAQKGNSKYRPLFLKKDIRFLMHDPLIWTIRNEQASYKKLRKAHHKHDNAKLMVIKRNKPIYRLDQNVLERYPTFVSAVKDLADPLTLIFLFSSIKVREPIKEHHISRCQRLRTEFLHYVVEAQCLTKAFISTKGYYYEVEIMGHRIVWTVPHNCVTEVPRNADMKIFRHYLEFSIAMLGFVNMRLLGKVHLRYPLKPAHIPHRTGKDNKDLDNFKNLIVSLNYPLERTQEKDMTNEEAEDIDSHLIEGSTEQTKKVFQESMQAVERRKLFLGLKVFISKENNRESLTMIIRACGGEVSWDSSMFPCSTFTEDDQSITHQIVDRPNVEKTHLSRYYVQPQWVFDCVNAATLHPCQPYFPDTELPAHICPFLKNYDGWYVPPEEQTLRKLLDATPAEKEEILQQLTKDDQERHAMMRALEADKLNSDEEDKSDDENDEASDDDVDDDDDDEEAEHNDDSERDVSKEDNDDDDEEMDVAEPSKPAVVKKPEVRRAKEMYVKDNIEKEKELHNDYKMKAFMIHKRNRKLYNKLREKEDVHMRQSTVLKERREAIELHKLGKITDEQLEVPKTTKFKKTIAQKNREKYRQNIKSAVRFSKSTANVNRDKKKAKK